jgi:hypothetical protein
MVLRTRPGFALGEFSISRIVALLLARAFVVPPTSLRRLQIMRRA